MGLSDQGQGAGVRARANPVQRFNEATNRHDIDGIREVLHPSFEMIVPQHPARGFKGMDQELKNMAYLFETHPDCHIETLRMVDAGDEIWVENHLTATDLEMAAVVVFGIDRESDTLLWGRYFSDPVDRGGPGADEWMKEMNESH